MEFLNATSAQAASVSADAHQEIAKYPLLTVVMVSFNTREDTLACLRSISQAESPGGLELVVVDNGSADDSAAAIAEEFPQAKVIGLEENIGFGRAVNLAVEHSADGHILLLNPDTKVHQGSIAALLRFARDNPEYRVYGGRTFRSDMTLDPSSCWGAPSLWSLFCYATGLSAVFKRHRVLDPESLGTWQRDTVRTVPIVTGCLLLISRADFLSLGGMNPVYFLYGEDADLSFRASRAGMRPVIVPSAVITHDSGGSTDGSGRKMCMVMAGRVTYLRVLWHPIRAAIGVGLLQTGILLRSVGETVIGRSAGTWTTVWKRRRDWRAGYPHAEAALFGRKVSAS